MTSHYEENEGFQENGSISEKTAVKTQESFVNSVKQMMGTLLFHFL